MTEERNQDSGDDADIDNDIETNSVALTFLDNAELHQAALAGDITEVRRLLAENADVNAHGTSDDDTPLHCASMGTHTEVIGILLEAKAQPNTVNANGETPLHLAARSNTTHTLQAITTLFISGASLLTRTNYPHLLTPLDYATGGEIGEANKPGYSFLKWAVKHTIGAPQAEAGMSTKIRQTRVAEFKQAQDFILHKEQLTQKIAEAGLSKRPRATTLEKFKSKKSVREQKKIAEETNLSLFASSSTFLKPPGKKRKAKAEESAPIRTGKVSKVTPQVRKSFTSQT